MSELISTLNKEFTNVTYDPAKIQHIHMFYEMAVMFMAAI